MNKEFTKFGEIYIKNKKHILYKKNNGKTIYIKHNKVMVPYNKKFKKMYAGISPEKYYLNSEESLNIEEYKNFLKTISKSLEFKEEYKMLFVKNTSICSCNIGSLSNIRYFTRGSNKVYIANIANTCVSNSVYFQNNIKKIILKTCRGDGDDIFETCLLADELINCIRYANLVINNITSNLMLFFGYMNNCKLIDNDGDIIADNNKDTVLFSNYINGITFANLGTKKLTIRQIFEYIYTAICCYASYGYYVADINYGNFMVYNDDFNTCITIDSNHMFYFNTTESVCIIDYQTNLKKESKISISDKISIIRRFVDPVIFEQLLEIRNGSLETVMKQFINCPCFQSYKIIDKSICSNYRDIKFDIISNHLI